MTPAPVTPRIPGQAPHIRAEGNHLRRQPAPRGLLQPIAGHPAPMIATRTPGRRRPDRGNDHLPPPLPREGQRPTGTGLDAVPDPDTKAPRKSRYAAGRPDRSSLPADGGDIRVISRLSRGTMSPACRAFADARLTGYIDNPGSSAESLTPARLLGPRRAAYRRRRTSISKSCRPARGCRDHLTPDPGAATAEGGLRAVVQAVLRPSPRSALR